MLDTLTTSPKAFCFVLMPFDQSFDDVYRIGIKEACATAGAYCERVDEQIFDESILERIFNQIAKADFIIADMTGRNPNVFYEVGYAHALGKRTILLTKEAADIPFDLKHFPHIIYGTSLHALREEITTRTKWYVQNPPEELSNEIIAIDLFVGDKNLAAGDAIHAFRDYSAAPTITIKNSSSTTLRPGDFKLGLITSSRHSNLESDHTSSTPLPDGTYIHMTEEFGTLFPQQYVSRTFRFFSSSPPEGETVTFRLFTYSGSRDYPLLVRHVPKDAE